MPFEMGGGWGGGAGLKGLDILQSLQNVGAGRAQGMAGIGGGASTDASAGTLDTSNPDLANAFQIGDGAAGGDSGSDITSALQASRSTNRGYSSDIADIGAGLGGGAGSGGSGGGGLNDFAPMLMKEIQRQFAANSANNGEEPLTKEDKGLALAQAGFGMAAGRSPHALTNIGEGASAGVQALQQMRQQRALLAMKNIQLLSAGVNAQYLNDQRVARTDNLRQVNQLTANSVLGPSDLQPLIDEAQRTGSATNLMAHLTGPAGPANKATALRMIPPGTDLANQVLAFTGAKAYTVQNAKVAAGPESYNPGEGAQLRQPGPALTVQPGGVITPVRPQSTGVGVRPPATTAVPPSPPPGPPGPPPPPAAATNTPITPPPPKPAPLTPQTDPTDQRWSLFPPVATLPSNDPATKKFSQGVAADQAKYYAEVNDQADAAKQNGYIYTNMINAAQHFPVGSGSTLYGNANKLLLTTARTASAAWEAGGGQPFDLSGLADKVGNGDDFDKNQTNFVGAAAKAVSPRASTQELKFLGGGVLNREVSPMGFRIIGAQVQALNDYNQAKQQAMELYRSNPKNQTHMLTGFDDWYNRNNDPAVYMMHRLSPEDAAVAYKNLGNAPGGKALQAKLQQQMDWVQARGLYPTA